MFLANLSELAILAKVLLYNSYMNSMPAMHNYIFVSLHNHDSKFNYTHHHTILLYCNHAYTTYIDQQVAYSLKRKISQSKCTDIDGILHV